MAKGVFPPKTSEGELNQASARAGSEKVTEASPKISRASSIRSISGVYALSASRKAFTTGPEDGGPEATPESNVANIGVCDEPVELGGSILGSAYRYLSGFGRSLSNSELTNEMSIPDSDASAITGGAVHLFSREGVLSTAGGTVW